MTPEKRIEGIWSGHVQGTNRGKILVRIKSDANGLTAKAMLYDEQLGLAEARFNGRISGDKAEFRLLEMQGLGHFSPRDGRVTLNLKEDGTAEGDWHTDIGTSGVIRVSRGQFGRIGWYRHMLSAKVSFVLQKWLAPIYGFSLVTIAVISIIRNATISYPALILLLVPVPFIFRSELAKLIAIVQTARIKKIGPIEFDQNPPTAEIIALATQQAQESIIFAHLNQFFALRTKILLAVLAHSNNGLAIAEFRPLALSFGVPPENLDVTIFAIQQANCVKVENERVLPTPLGQRYVRVGMVFTLARGVTTP